ncbi:rhomboid protease ROM1 [Toxoplasma gondii TgCatPRC2]|uniref:Rhomboid-like protease 1 n=16 Tax=Toxoplasma gondii TaxID=5811 RepID=RHBL1_TOXGO|nr:RecName: Full=Rhomboid-like protease 1 [Toxoplasma gondii]EPR64979.1 rhomboid protease ROM1 [Toxoplasma gondii GT1]ESS36469.1 rhomboid protease ROM1 [Toxoplasma gondii VEG]KFG27949.1 rhomboid protease ROM1 [Toxoplasma gondii p89]KFG29600.1 rhomboid protease ROM1 [Toxoplasma gondii GAB2-2007-GAL-DOM2]KFG32672.1 rhomboid protease ROM1 [Toxoplasma gondii FOU]KFG56756.1 rhomboid protease ROM1 [Toxoplasma gondii RUB]KFG99400.1 rhomboid protease ROM1 [Toxoplasma gondii VAND]KFH01560.1 rhomboid
MARVRTLADLRTEDEADEHTPLYNAETGSRDSDSTSSGGAAPRSMPIRFLELLFPHFSLKSVVLAISIVDWIFYIVTVCLDTELPLIPAANILVHFGANYPPLIKQGQVWRLLLPVFLHANFFHVFFNVFFQLRMGFTIERRYGLLKFTGLYFASAIYGNLLSATAFFCNSLKVGASTAGFGLIGIQICEMALTWHRMRHRDRMLTNMVSFVLLMVLLMFTLNGGSIDQMGHLGGLLCGFSIGMLYNKELNDKPVWYPWASAAAIGILLALPAACFPILYAVDRHCHRDLSYI